MIITILQEQKGNGLKWLNKVQKNFRNSKRKKIGSFIVVILLIFYYFCLPRELFNKPTSTLIESSEGDLLGAKIAADGQWRFPKSDSIPYKFKTCIVQFEDAYFHKHFGFNLVSIFKAFKGNISSGKRKRGGSTLTQQVVRILRDGKSRTYQEKFLELILATRLEFRSSKEEILELYAANAPFGGNVVGLEAASWRYFGRSSFDLSWAETATLAVLPNAPSLIYPGKNQTRLFQKRNNLLKKLESKGIIDELTYKLSIEEPLPQKPFPLPRLAPHLLEKVVKSNRGERVATSIKTAIQTSVNDIIKLHYNELKQNHIYNISALILEVKTRKVIAYVGNSPTDKEHHKDVDIIDKPRSTGSVLKPFLYAAMLDAGDLLPNTLIPDIPTQIGNYNPKNFNDEYDGMVFASEALARSLNIPAVRMLQNFGLDHFYHYLKKLKLKDIRYNANHYGLSLILGGAESNLWDLCKSYASMSSTVNHYDENYGEYYSNEFLEPSVFKDFEPNFGTLSTEKTIFDAGSTYLTIEAMKKVNRPRGIENWEQFGSSEEIAWKTGTSFGFRDAWAIGMSSDYVVGVWVGNADGEGRPGLVGSLAAAPILFELYKLLPKSKEFAKPFDELAQVAICSKSGYRASEFCEEKSQQFIQFSGLKTQPCPFHFWVHLDLEEKYQVNTSCESLVNMTHKSWFVLPPLAAHYYQKKNPYYKKLPKFRSDCVGENLPSMDFIYPKKFTSVYLPKDFDEQTKGLIVKVTHKVVNMKLFWYLNNQFVDVTQGVHEKEIKPKKGNHLITVVDELGNEIRRKIVVKE